MDKGVTATDEAKSRKWPGHSGKGAALKLAYNGTLGSR